MNTSEELIKIWNQLSYVLKPKRLFSKLSYNEQTICSILMNNEECYTATDLIQMTGLLKSQMNKIMSQLEEKKVIERVRLKEDKRKMVIFLTDYGKSLYKSEHQIVLEIGNHITQQLGNEKSEQLVSLMKEALESIEGEQK